MSRTRKDRPYWVRCNDASQAGRKVYHNHELAGTPSHAYRVKKDADGNVVTESRPVFQYAKKIYHYTDGHVQEVEYGWYGTAKSSFYEGELDYVEHVPSRHVSKQFPVMEKYVVGFYSDHCTADRPRESIFGVWEDPEILCWVELERWVSSPWRHRPNKKAKRNYHSSARNSEQSASRDVVKSYNSGEDVDENWEGFTTRQKRHVGWWA